jgi:hypothetical protein
VSTHEALELLADALKETETVVLSQSLQEVLDDVALVVTGDLLELLDDLLLVAGGEGGGRDDVGQLAVGLEGLSKAGESLGGLVESGGLGRGSVQCSGIGSINAKESHGGLDVLSRGSISPQTVESGSARDGELLGGTQAKTGDTSGVHRGGDVRRPRGEGEWKDIGRGNVV